MLFSDYYVISYLCCINLCKAAKHWDSFLSNCITYYSVALNHVKSLKAHYSGPIHENGATSFQSVLLYFRLHPSAKKLGQSEYYSDHHLCESNTVYSLSSGLNYFSKNAL